MASCTDLSGLEKRLDSAESDIQAVQTQITVLNENQKALAELKELEALKGAIVISSVVEDNTQIIINLSNGDTITILKDANEEPVGLQGVEVVDGRLVVTINENETVSVPVVSNFIFAIKKGGEVVKDVQTITEGTTVEFDVEQTGVASAAIVSCPAGFEVELSETKLAVTAHVKTKATASSSKDIAILAVSSNGFSIVSKIQVVAAGGEDVGVPAGASFENTTHECYTFNSAKFKVTFTDASKLYYQVLPASKTAPDAETLKALTPYEKAAEEGEDFISVASLVPATDYKVYYLTSDGENFSDVCEYAFATRAVNENNLYELYATGQTITVGGLEINTTNYPDATYICRGTSTRGVPKEGLCFIESHEEIAAAFNSGVFNLVVIGTDPAKRSIVNRDGVVYVSAVEEATADEFLVMANVIYNDTKADNAEGFKFNKAFDFKTITFENCQFNLPASYRLVVTNGKTFTDFKMVGCDVKFGQGATIVTSGTSETTHGTMHYENNVFYGESGTSNVFLVDGTKHSVAKVTLKSNTLYNIAATKNVGYVRVKTLSAINVTDNLFYNCQGADYHTYIYNTGSTTAATASASHNISSVPADATNKVYIVNGTSPAGVTNPSPTAYAFPTTDWDPANGSFKIDGTNGEDYYGAKR